MSSPCSLLPPLVAARAPVGSPLCASVAGRSPRPSPLEDLFLPICSDFGIRFPAVNVPVLDYVVDCLWLPERLVVELDGYEWHRGRESFEDDRRRDIKLSMAGYPVLRLTDRRMRAERADVAADVASMLEQPAPTRAAAG